MSSQQNNIRSSLITIQEMVSESAGTQSGLARRTQLNIPLYQRLYVWENEQIERLLSDIEQARQQAKQNNQRDTAFYLGGITLVDKSDAKRGTHTADLIDGQQRFTTLWLLCNYLYEKLDHKEADESDQALRTYILKFIRVPVPATENPEHYDYSPRLHFTARELQNKALADIAPRVDASHSLSKSPDEESETPTDRLIKPLYQARAVFEAFFREEAPPYREFARYLLEHVRLVVTVVPSIMDLNKLFEVINSRGLQLQHHEILKARLLNGISPERQPHYAALWDACADMRGFADQNLSRATTLQANQLAELFGGENPAHSDLAKGNELINKLADQSDAEALSGQHSANLEDILNGSVEVKAKVAGKPKNHPSDESDDEYRLWSEAPLTFSMLLQHTLRIWLHENSDTGDIKKIDDKWLVECFEAHGFSGRAQLPQGQASSLIQLLWQIRFILDYYVIKWVDLGEEKVLKVVKAARDGNKSEVVIRRSRQSDASSGLSLLQAMLYHSQASATQYWLTPFLHFVYQQKCPLDEAYEYLRHLDNVLFGRPNQLPVSLKPLVKRTRYLMTHPLSDLTETIEGATKHHLDFKHELGQESQQPEHTMGTAFPQYWFYKLDFVLWYLNAEEVLDPPLSKESIFRMTARNSVEHVSPQTPRPGEKAEDCLSTNKINCFGNLALVSRPVNSEFSNLSFNEKQAKFKASLSRTKHSPSLKMEDIYRHKEWNDATMIAHQRRMIQAMEYYYEKTTYKPLAGSSP